MGRPANPQKFVRTNNVPTVPSELKKLKGMVKEAVDAMYMIRSQNEKLVDIKNEILENFPITGKLMNRLIAFEFNQDFDKVSTEQNEIFEAYEALKNAEDK